MCVAAGGDVYGGVVAALKRAGCGVIRVHGEWFEADRAVLGEVCG